MKESELWLEIAELFEQEIPKFGICTEVSDIAMRHNVLSHESQMNHRLAEFWQSYGSNYECADYVPHGYMFPVKMDWDHKYRTRFSKLRAKICSALAEQAKEEELS